jgi:hypothetical protein
LSLIVLNHFITLQIQGQLLKAPISGIQQGGAGHITVQFPKKCPTSWQEIWATPNPDVRQDRAMEAFVRGWQHYCW